MKRFILKESVWLLIAAAVFACHKEIHCNPYLNIKLMEEKAAELEIKLSERYNFT